jgi:hypothetical protein
MKMKNLLGTTLVAFCTSVFFDAPRVPFSPSAAQAMPGASSGIILTGEQENAALKAFGLGAVRAEKVQTRFEQVREEGYLLFSPENEQSLSEESLVAAGFENLPLEPFSVYWKASEKDISGVGKAMGAYAVTHLITPELLKRISERHASQQNVEQETKL